jgi:hypothetical protein
MERIHALIAKLNEQAARKADSSILLATTELLKTELMNAQGYRNPAPPVSRTLGTSKVAVVMPASMNNRPEYERFAPKAAAEPTPAAEETQNKEESVETVETLLVDKGTVSIVQENGQLDMVFDPMVEIPTLSQQVKPADRGNANAGESLNDKLKQGKTELVEVLKETPVKDLRKAIGINDRFLFINELFRGDEAMYERSIKTINGFNIFPEAEYWISRELKLKLGWNVDHQAVSQFDQLVKRRFS